MRTSTIVCVHTHHTHIWPCCHKKQEIVLSLRNAGCWKCRAPNLSPLPCRNVSASLRGSFLLPGPEEIQIAAAARPGGVADRAVRVSPGCPAREAPGVGLRARPAPQDPASPGHRARPRLHRPRLHRPRSAAPSVQIAEIIAAKGAHVPGQNWELIPTRVRVLLEERRVLESLHFRVTAIYFSCIFYLCYLKSLLQPPVFK